MPNMAMAVLTAVALLCYLANLLTVSPAAVTSLTTAIGPASATDLAAENSPTAQVSPTAPGPHAAA